MVQAVTLHLRFKIQFIDEKGRERSIGFMFREEYEGDIIEAMRTRSSRKIRVTARSLPNSESPKDIETIEIELLEPMDPAGRLEEIIGIVAKNIKEDLETEQYVQRIRALEDAMATNYSCPHLPYIYPTPDNNLEFEWNDNSYVMTLDLETMKAELIGENEEDEESLDLNEIGSWEKLCGLISDGTGFQ